MNTKTFYKLLKKMNDEEVKIMVGKGKEYTMSSDDKLKNFKEVGKMLGLPPLKVASAYWLKHVFSIINYVKTGKITSDEPIKGRFADARNYLALMYAIIEDEGKKEDYKMLPNIPAISREALAKQVEAIRMAQQGEQKLTRKQWLEQISKQKGSHNNV